MGEPKYRDSDWLRREYYEKQRTITEIADELGVDHTTISKWRRKLDIPKPTAEVTLECPVCGDGFTRPESKVERVKHANVCSRECLYEGRSEGIIGREVKGGYDTSKTEYTKECPACGEEFTTTASKDYRHCSRDCFLDMHSERMSDEGNPAYVDGSTKEKRCYRGSNWVRIRRRVYERDGYTCQRCGVKCISRSDYNGENGGEIIQAHHISGYEDESDNELDNLITLCASCHSEVEGGACLDV